MRIQGPKRGKSKGNQQNIAVAPSMTPAFVPDHIRLLTASNKSLEEAIAKLRPYNTFQDLAEIARYSRSEVSQQLHERFHDCKEKAMKNRSGVEGNGARWIVYKAAAAMWLEEIYG
jgi:hypothetical protein